MQIYISSKDGITEKDSALITSQLKEIIDCDNTIEQLKLTIKAAGPNFRVKGVIKFTETNILCMALEDSLYGAIARLKTKMLDSLAKHYTALINQEEYGSSRAA